MTVAGLIDEVKKRGPRVILTLDDRTGRIEVTLFEEVFQKHRELIAKDALVLVEGMLRFDDFSDAWRLAARRISELARCASTQARRLVLTGRDGDRRRTAGAPGSELCAVAPGGRARHGRVPRAAAQRRAHARGRVEGARHRASCSSSSRRCSGARLRCTASASGLYAGRCRSGDAERLAAAERSRARSLYAASPSALAAR